MSLKIIIGCMFSGKSSEIIRETRRLKVINKKVLLINHCNDTRYSNGNIWSHDQISIDSFSLGDLTEIPDSILEFSINSLITKHKLSIETKDLLFSYFPNG